MEFRHLTARKHLSPYYCRLPDGWTAFRYLNISVVFDIIPVLIRNSVIQSDPILEQHMFKINVISRTNEHDRHDPKPPDETFPKLWTSETVRARH